MSLIDKFRKNFITVSQNAGFTVEEKDNIILAKKADTLIKLELLYENFGSNRVSFSRVTVILGDYGKSDYESILKNKNLDDKNKVEKKIFTLYPLSGNATFDDKLSDQLIRLKGLKTEIFKNNDFIAFVQFGTHDLILKDPITVQMLMGKISLSQLIDKIKSLDLPSGWIIQKPKGLGDPKKANIWKIIGILVPVIYLLYFIIRMIIKYIK
jgi:hypothetical protein